MRIINAAKCDDSQHFIFHKGREQRERLTKKSMFNYSFKTCPVRRLKIIMKILTYIERYSRITRPGQKSQQCNAENLHVFIIVQKKQDFTFADPYAGMRKILTRDNLTNTNETQFMKLYLTFHIPTHNLILFCMPIQL